MILMNKVILIGIDGGTFDLIKPLVEKGELPTFRKVLRESAYGNLKSTIPCLSVPAIPSLFTGMNPGKLGVFGFLKADGSSVTYNDIKEDYLWDVLAENGVRSCIVGVTGTYPPMIRNGIMISGSAPSEHSEYVYPKELKSKVSGFYSEFDLLKKLESNPQKNMSRILGLAILSERKKWKTFKDLMKSDNFGLGVFWIVLSDDIQHFYWGFEDAIVKFYKEIDNILKDLIETFEDCNIIIVSDHGFESRMKYYFHVNSWLREKGYLKMKGKKLEQWFIYRVSAILQYLWRLLPRKMKYSLLKLTPSKSMSYNEVSSRNFFFLGVDLENTIMYTDSSLGIRLNVKNQELHDRMLSKIIVELKNLKDNAGNPIVREMWKREEIFLGKYATETPDIILLPAKDYQMNVFLSEKIVTNIQSNKKKRFRGDHLNSRNGIFIAYGPNFKSGYEIEGLSILDVAPTILHIMGCGVPKKIDGKVIREIFTKESGFIDKDTRIQKERKKVRRDKEITPEEKDQILERLKALGYLG